MHELEEISVRPISNFDIMSGSPIPAIDRLKVISATEYEECIAEWCVEFLSTKYEAVKRRGGSGDKGQDIVATLAGGETYDLYQCKHYKSPLAPSDIWTELGKLVYYTFTKQYIIPNHYFIVAPCGVGQKLSDLVLAPQSINTALIEVWETECKTKIRKEPPIPLEDNLRQYILGFDFSIIHELNPVDFIEQFKQTKYYVARFGGGLTKFREVEIEVPLLILETELIYVSELIKAYSDYKKEILKTESDLKERYPDLHEHLVRQRKKFHSAQALQRFIRDTIPGESIYVRLQRDFYDGLIDLVEDDYENGYARLKRVLVEAGRLQISNVVNQSEHFRFSIDDRGGICHQLVNDGKFQWVKS